MSVWSLNVEVVVQQQRSLLEGEKVSECGAVRGSRIVSSETCSDGDGGCEWCDCY